MREAELRGGRADGYIKPEIVREVWQEHIDELVVDILAIVQDRALY